MMSRRTVTRLWGDDVAALGFDLHDGEARCIPAAAESFDQNDACDQPLAVDSGGLLFVLQQVLLRGDDVEVVDQAALVAAGGNVERGASGVNGLLLFLLRFAQEVER